MSELPSLISDLAIILMAAGIITVIFKAIKQPVVLGYILAGIVAGPSLHFFQITDTENIKTWADIGVIFLLFALGLDFSFKKLFKMGTTVFVTAFTIVVGMITLGYFTGKILGWSHLNCLFLGGMLAMSSTMIIIKSYDDMGIKNQLFASLVIGVLIVEDLVAVILMVILSMFAVSDEFSGMDLIENVLQLVIFVLICFTTGIYLLPSILKKTRKWLNDETLLVVSVALCLTMVLIATGMDFSSALGAFMMGSLLAETLEAEKIARVIRPVKDLFGAIFFVSVGMMINPMGILENWLPILLITIVVIGGQITFGSLGMLFSGQPLKIAMQSGFSLVQVGEFAFIIAQLGLSLGVTTPDLYPIIVAVSVITTFFTPFSIKLALPAYDKFVGALPPKWLKVIENLSFVPKMGVSGVKSSLIKTILSYIFFYLAIIVVIISLGLNYLHPFVQSQLGSGFLANLISATIILLCMSPFLRAIIVKKNRSIFHEMREQNINRGLLIGLIATRCFICVVLVIFVLSEIFHAALTILIVFALGIIAFLVFSKWIKRNAIVMENHFVKNLTAREEEEEKQKPISKDFENHLISRDVHLSEITVHPLSPNAGRKLSDIHMRENYGVNIVSILRGDMRINIPSGNDRLFPHDRLVVCGTDEQLQKFSKIVAEYASKGIVAPKQNVTLEHIVLGPDSGLIGKTIKNASLRDTYRCMIVGIERDNTSMMNPDVDEEFKAGDVLWVVGEKEKIIELSRSY